MPARLLIHLVSILLLGAAVPAQGKTPAWLQQLAAAPLPAQSPEVDAVQLLSEVRLVVASNGQMHKRVRGAVRILRKEGQSRAVVRVPQNTWQKLQDMHGWGIPVSGKDLEVRMKDAVETSVVDVDGSELITDLRMKVLTIPGMQPGATVGYEYELALSPLEIADQFPFQDTIPVLEARYALQLPPGWNVTPNWVNHAGMQPESSGAQQWQWTVRDLPPITIESGMPAWQGVAGHLFLALSPPGAAPRLSTWSGIGAWFVELALERRVASDGIRSKVAELVAGMNSDLDRVRALASFVQRDVRYVGIQLGIGGFQPHAAAEVFQHRYGDCKDKATLLAVMLAEIGIDSVQVLVNTDRSLVRPDMPPSLLFDHVILAIRLPAQVQSPALLATIVQADGSRLLLFDPTDEQTALGRIRGALQGSHGLLAQADGSRLVQLPRGLPEQNGNHRTARLVLNDRGELSGEVKERITGEVAAQQRGFLRAATRDSDLVKPVERRLAESLSSFRLISVVARNRETSELPLEWDFTLSAESYARRSGDLLMLRPRVLGTNAYDLPGEDRKRVHDLILTEQRVNRDEFLITLPPGYMVESLPLQVEMDVGFATYRSRTEVAGPQLKYTRSLEVRALLVPAAGVEDFRRLNREILRDERAVVVLKRAAP
jgi:hypothetical protein